MLEKLTILKSCIEKEFPHFTGRISVDMIMGEVGAIEQTYKNKYETPKANEHFKRDRGKK